MRRNNLVCPSGGRYLLGLSLVSADHSIRCGPWPQHAVTSHRLPAVAAQGSRTCACVRPERLLAGATCRSLEAPGPLCPTERDMAVRGVPARM